MARGAEERAESLRLAAASARRVADDQMLEAATAAEEAERAKMAYENAQRMHTRAFAVANSANASFQVAEADVKRRKKTVTDLLEAMV